MVPPCCRSLPHFPPHPSTRGGFQIFHVDLSLFEDVFFYFILFLSYPSTHLNLFACAVSHSAGGFRSALFYLCGWLTGGHGAGGVGEGLRPPPRGLGSGI